MSKSTFKGTHPIQSRTLMTPFPFSYLIFASSSVHHWHPQDHWRISNQRYVQVSWLWEEIRAPQKNHKDNEEHSCYGGTVLTTAPQITLPGIRPRSQIKSGCNGGTLWDMSHFFHAEDKQCCDQRPWRQRGQSQWWQACICTAWMLGLWL